MSAISPTIAGISAYKAQVRWALGLPEDITYTVYGPSAASLLAGQQPPNGGILPLTWDGTAVAARLLSNGAQLVYDQPGYVTETGKSIALGLQLGAIIHRFTAQQITVLDAFTGQANGIRTLDTHTICAGLLPDQQGIALTPVGLPAQHAALSFIFKVDPAVQTQLLDVDVNEDNLLHATQVIAQYLGTYVDPQQTQVLIDSGDTGPDGGKTVAIGRKGATSISFDGSTVPVLRLSTAQAQTTDMCASCTFKGGDSHHGLPTSGKITDLSVLPTGMAVVGVYGAIDVGGVYFWPGDGSLYPMSQAMGVTRFWLTGTAYGEQLIYAATDAGVFVGKADVTDRNPWVRWGAMSLKCLKVMTSAGVSYCLVEFAGSGDRHILKHVPGVTDNLGYDDWTSITSAPGMSDFAVTANYCYYLLRNSPGVIGVHRLDGTVADTQIVLTTGAAILGLDPDSDGDNTVSVFVRTDQGSAELYAFGDGATGLAPQNTDNTLADDYGAPVMVNRITRNLPRQLQCSTSTAPSLVFAATSLGVFSAFAQGGGSWQRTDGQSSIGDFACTVAAAGPVGDHQPVYAVADTAFYYSNNGSVNWIDAFSQPLDAGPYFYNHFRVLGRWPTAADTSIPVNFGTGAYTLERALTGIGQWSYVLVNPTSAAPAGQHRSAELSEISSPALMSEITASRLLVQGMARFLAYTARPQVIVEVESVAFDTSSPLFGVRPTMAATVTVVPMDYVIGQGDPFALGTLAINGYVLEHTITYDRDINPGAVTTLTRIGILLLDDRSDPLRVTADLFYQLSRAHLYRTKSRR